MKDEKKDEKKLERLYASREQGAKSLVIGFLLYILGHLLQEKTSMVFGASVFLYGMIACISSIVRIESHDEKI